MFDKGFKYLIIVALLISLREATYLISFVSGLPLIRDLLTKLTIIVLTFSILQFKEQVTNLINSVKDKRLIELINR